jgi:pimeloyl-ACP methyl ester carboxylesterase
VADLPTLLLPGLDGTGNLFAPLLAELQAPLMPTVVQYPCELALTYEDLVAFVEQQLPAGPFALVGESFSGPLAIRIAARHPTSCVGLVLVATFIRSPIQFPKVLRFLLRPSVFALPPPAFVVRRLLAGEDAPVDLLNAFAAALRQVRADVIAARVREVLRVDESASAAQLPMPVMYLAGGRDRLVSVTALEELRRWCSHLESVFVDAPHLVLQRKPAEAAATIQGFLGRARAVNP